MGVMSKLMFWKKEDDFKDLGFDKDFAADLGGPTNFGQNDSFGQQDNLGLDMPSNRPQQISQSYPPPIRPQPAYQPQSYQPYQPQKPDHEYIVSKEIEVLSSKIDAIRVTLESVNQRLARIEKIAEASQDDQQRNW